MSFSKKLKCISCLSESAKQEIQETENGIFITHTCGSCKTMHYIVINKAAVAKIKINYD